MSSMRVEIMVGATALAMQAKCGAVSDIDQHDVLTKVQQTLDDKDPLARLVTAFVVSLETGPTGEDLHRIGADLHDALQLMAVPDPVDAERKDIYG